MSFLCSVSGSSHLMPLPPLAAAFSDVRAAPWAWAAYTCPLPTYHRDTPPSLMTNSQSASSCFLYDSFLYTYDKKGPKLYKTMKMLDAMDFTEISDPFQPPLSTYFSFMFSLSPGFFLRGSWNLHWGKNRLRLGVLSLITPKRMYRKLSRNQNVESLALWSSLRKCVLLFNVSGGSRGG